MKLKKLTALFLAASMMAVTAGCGSNAATQTPADSQETMLEKTMQQRVPSRHRQEVEKR